MRSPRARDGSGRRGPRRLPDGTAPPASPRRDPSTPRSRRAALGSRGTGTRGCSCRPARWVRPGSGPGGGLPPRRRPARSGPPPARPALAGARRDVAPGPATVLCPPPWRRSHGPGPPAAPSSPAPRDRLAVPLQQRPRLEGIGAGGKLGHELLEIQVPLVLLRQGDERLAQHEVEPVLARVARELLQDEPESG